MIYLLQNDPHVPSGHFGELLVQWGVDHRTVHLFDGASWPSAAAGDGIILLGGYMGADEGGEYPHLDLAAENIQEEVARQTPLLGICLGAQLLSKALGGVVYKGYLGERGTGVVFLSHKAEKDPLLDGLSSPLSVLQWHQDSFEIPPHAERLGWSPACPNQVFRCGVAYGVQFHPEVTGSILSEWVLRHKAPREILQRFLAEGGVFRRNGELLLRNFLSLCGIRSRREEAG